MQSKDPSTLDRFARISEFLGDLRCFSIQQPEARERVEKEE